MKDFKRVYKASIEESAIQELDLLEVKWRKNIKFWRNNWPNISVFFK